VLTDLSVGGGSIEWLVAWQDGKECKSDVRVLLHSRRANGSFSSRETQFWKAERVRVLLHRKKIGVQRMQRVGCEDKALAEGVSQAC
jgi:hypothetical protein